MIIKTSYGDIDDIDSFKILGLPQEMLDFFKNHEDAAKLFFQEEIVLTDIDIPPEYIRHIKNIVQFMKDMNDGTKEYPDEREEYVEKEDENEEDEVHSRFYR